jgi:tetratricopeptide (TPR) repeat protein
MFKETLDSMSRIDLTDTPDSLKAEYYALMGRYYYDLGDYDKDSVYTPVYNTKAAHYIDSALAIWHPDTYSHIYFSGLKELKLGRNAEAKSNFSKLLEIKTLSPHQVAVTASTLSDIEIREGNIDHAIALLAEAASADIISSTKETSAAFNLANQLYKKGDVKTASLCINKAITDAAFYGARQRKIQVSAILPLIEAEKLNIVESQKERITLYAVLVSLLLLAVVGLAITVYRQVQKLKHAQKLITDAHHKEQEINHRLIETNHLLSDANKIKEEYIGYFFSTNSDIFTRIEKFKKTLEQKIAYRKMDEIITVVNNINLKKEKEELVRNFDRVFLKLFPNFVTEYNALFAPEDQVILKDNELLNTDLRIFALIRMGIHDNEKIAEILEYSVHTINTYKTRIKNKSIVPNEEFESRIMKIRTV